MTDSVELLRTRLKLRGNLKAAAKQAREGVMFRPDDDPPIDENCWVYHLRQLWVARAVVRKKIPGTADYDDTWRVKIVAVEEPGWRFYEQMTETVLRSQIWPTKRECYSSLYAHIEQEIIQKERDIDDLQERLKDIERITA